MTPILMSTADIARLLGVPTGTVHRWASEDAWTRHGTRAARRWDYDQAQRSHDQRRTGDGADAAAPQQLPGRPGLTPG